MTDLIWLFGMVPAFCSASWVGWAVACRRNGRHPRREARRVLHELAAASSRLAVTLTEGLGELAESIAEAKAR